MAWTEVTAKRTQTAKHWRDGDTPRHLFQQILKTPLHYRSTTGGPLDREINLDPVRVNNAALDGWRVTNNGWHYALGIPGDGILAGQDGVIGFGGRAGAHWLKLRLARVGYLHAPTRAWEDLGGTPTYNRANLTTHTETVTIGPGEAARPLQLASSAEWAGLWPGVNLRWRIDGLQLKQEIVLAQATRENLPLPSTPIPQTYFGFVFRLDPSDIPRWTIGGVPQDPNGDFETDQQIELRDTLDRLLAFLPLDFAYSQRYEHDQDDQGQPEYTRDRVTLRRRIWHDPDGQHYLLVGAPVQDLNAMQPGPILFDPSFSDQPDESSMADTYHDTGNADTNYETDTRLIARQAEKHIYLEFDASSIDGSATCDTAVLHLWSEESASEKTYGIYSNHSNVATWDEATLTWNIYKAATSWPGSAGGSTSGTDYEADASAPTITFPHLTIDTEATADLTTGNNLDATRIAGWFGGSNTNYGLSIGPTGDGSSRDWHSSSAATAGYRPKIVIGYTEAGGAASILPLTGVG